MGSIKNSCFFFLFVLAFTSSCSAEDDDRFIDIIKDSITVENDHHFNILIIGDSFSRDAFTYVPFVMEDVCQDITLDMDILYIGGRALNYHYDYLSKDTPGFILDLYTSAYGYWTSYPKVRGGDVIRSKEWDLIILQEGSNTTRSYAKTQPHVQNLSDYIHLIQENVEIAFMLSPAKPEGSSALGEYTSDEVWYMNVTTTKQLLDNNDVDCMIPCGTSIQNARQTSLDQYGYFGHLSYDGNHLQEGLPCLIEAYTAAETLFKFFEIQKTIDSCNLIVTQAWVSSKKIPGQHGLVIEGDENDYSLCKKSALLAVDNPFTISSPSFITTSK